MVKAGQGCYENLTSVLFDLLILKLCTLYINEKTLKQESSLIFFLSTRSIKVSGLFIFNWLPLKVFNFVMHCNLITFTLRSYFYYFCEGGILGGELNTFVKKEDMSVAFHCQYVLKTTCYNCVWFLRSVYWLLYNNVQRRKQPSRYLFCKLQINIQ